ncbi:hypothetical protein GCM10020369_51340 [Cryptosporangium minutisporangium]|uniref:Mop domain-containing protein n=1 Tax=Cryptosporangium minutisporangium TaxID=113569 RepID=A0ABP6T4C7_9ACTN
MLTWLGADLPHQRSRRAARRQRRHGPTLGRRRQASHGAGPGSRLAIDGRDLAAFATDIAASDRPAGLGAPIVAESARNRFTGIVTRVVRDGVMAQVEIQAGPHRVVSLMSRESADELGLEPGVLAVAAVKSTNVVVEVPRHPD